MPDDEAWILFCLGLAKDYLQFVCGQPSDESKLEVTWHEHKLGGHPSLGVWYDLEPPMEYIAAAEDALDIFNNSVSWTALKEFWENQEEGKKEEDEWDEVVDED